MSYDIKKIINSLTGQKSDTYIIYSLHTQPSLVCLPNKKNILQGSKIFLN